MDIITFTDWIVEYVLQALSYHYLTVADRI